MLTSKMLRTCCTALLVIACLAGCASSRLPQQAELATLVQIPETQFENISRCSFLSVSYGWAAQQTMKPGAIATTPDTFFIFQYESKTDSFQTAFAFPYRDIQCVTATPDNPGKGMTSIITKDGIATVVPLLPESDSLNLDAENNLLLQFKSKGIVIRSQKLEVLSPFISYKTYVRNPCQAPTVIPRKSSNSPAGEPAIIRAHEQPVTLYPNIWTTVIGVDGKKIDAPLSERKKPFSIPPGLHQVLLFRGAGKYSSQALVTVDIAPGEILQIGTEFQGGDVYLWLEDAKTGELVSPKTIAPSSW